MRVYSLRPSLNLKPASALALDDGLAVLRAQLDLSNVTTSALNPRHWLTESFRLGRTRDKPSHSPL
jgi:hypothetical protein